MVAELAASLAASEEDRLEQAEALVRSYCGWHIAPSRAETVTVFRSSRDTVILPSLYVSAVTSVTDDDTEVDADDYTWTAGGVLSRSWWAWSCEPISVQMTHGYDDPPKDVTAVVQAVAQRAVNNPGSMVRTQVGPFADTYSQTGFNQSLPMALLDAEKSILDRYKLPPRP